MLSCVKIEMIRFASQAASSVFSVVWDTLPLCICPLVDLLQLIHEILLAPIIWLPIHICRARQGCCVLHSLLMAWKQCAECVLS